MSNRSTALLLGQVFYVNGPSLNGNNLTPNLSVCLQRQNQRETTHSSKPLRRFGFFVPGVRMCCVTLLRLQEIAGFLQCNFSDLPGGPVVRNPPTRAGGTGSIPGRGRSHVPRGN